MYPWNTYFRNSFVLSISLALYLHPSPLLFLSVSKSISFPSSLSLSLYMYISIFYIHPSIHLSTYLSILLSLSLSSLPSLSASLYLYPIPPLSLTLCPVLSLSLSVPFSLPFLYSIVSSPIYVLPRFLSRRLHTTSIRSLLSWPRTMDRQRPHSKESTIGGWHVEGKWKVRITNHVTKEPSRPPFELKRVCRNICTTMV